MKTSRKDKIDFIADQALELDRLQDENAKLRKMYAEEASYVRLLTKQNVKLRDWFKNRKQTKDIDHDLYMLGIRL